MDEFASAAPLQPTYAQQAVGVTFPSDAPATYKAGTDHVKFDLSSLAMTDPSDLRDTSVTIKLGATDLGSFPVTVTLLPPADGNSNDEAGTASVDVVLPAGTPTGTATLVVSGATTGTSALVLVPVTGVTTPPPPPPVPVVTTVGGAAKPFRYGDAGTLDIVISRTNATGQVDVFDDTGAKIGSATITAGKGVLALAPKSLEPGVHKLTLKYLGTAAFAPSQATVDVRVLKAKPKVKVKVDDTVDKAGGDEVVVRVTAPDGIKVTGKVKLIIKGTGKSVTVKLVKGKAVIELPKIGKVGTFTLKAKYLGSDLLTREGKNVKVDVTS